VLVGGKNPGAWYSDKEILEIRTKAFEEAKKYCAKLERDHSRWIRLFNRLDAAVSRHIKEIELYGFEAEYDRALRKAHEAILKAAADG
jgi:hypothetical protein